MRFFIACVVLMVFLACGCVEEKKVIKDQDSAGDSNADGSLVPRTALFSSPLRSEAKISPDGSRISYLAPVNGIQNIWVMEPDEEQAEHPVTRETERNISNYAWAYTNRHLLYQQDLQGNGNWRIFSHNLSSGRTRDLTPFKSTSAHILAIAPKHPQEIVISLNERDPKYPDIYKVDIETEKITLLEKNIDFDGFEIDDDFEILLAYKDTSEGGRNFFRPSDDGWISFFNVSSNDMQYTKILGFNHSKQAVYLSDSRNRDTSALYVLDLISGERKLIAENPKADLTDVIIDPSEKDVQAAAFTYDRKRWKIIEESIANDLLYLSAVDNGDVEILGRSLDDRSWLLSYLADEKAAHYYYYDREEESASFLFTANEDLEGYRLSRMIPAIIKSRDGLNLVSYYTIPPESDRDGDNRPDQPVPMVLYVHDGPWERDYWGFNPVHQWLANRGYAVLSVNYRGSSGFGKSFMDRGNGEWGSKMQQDLLDAANWSIKEGIADSRRIAIMGEGYGGYAALAGLAFSPNVFACGVDINGPSNLISSVESISQEPEKRIYATRVGDILTEEGREKLESRSPFYFPSNIQKPLLIFQGGKDSEVKREETEDLVHRLTAEGKTVTYVLYPEEGHEISRREHERSLYAITEAFLAEHLGGLYEPIGRDLQDQAIAVPVGADEIPGLESALSGD
jgi:dipeptidyl aminopeptidase/acylaminoacyl peptidase